MSSDKDNRLSKEDIKALLENPNDSETKIRVIKKLSRQYNSSDFSKSQLDLAEQIFRLLISYAETEVKKVLSENLMSNSMVPQDVVLSLAKDVEEVALPIIEFSDVLTDEDLIEIIKTTEKIACQIAIANRGKISEIVSGALVETNNEEVVDNLLQNENATISESSYEKLVINFPRSERIVSSMIKRGSLSKNIIDRMTLTVSSAIQKKLEQKYKTTFKEINSFFKQSGAVAASKFMGMQPVERKLIERIDDLNKENKLEEELHPTRGRLMQLLDGLEIMGKLTPLSSLAMGHEILFVILLARLTGVPFANAKKLMLETDEGLKALYERAQLPEKMYDSVQFVASLIRKINKKSEEEGTPRASDDLHTLMSSIVNESKGKHIKNLSQFVSLIQHHLKEREASA